jgi:hypothetical protein
VDQYWDSDIVIQAPALPAVGVPCTVGVTSKVTFNQYLVSVWLFGLQDPAKADSSSSANAIERSADLSGKTLWVTWIDQSDEIPTGTYLDAIWINGHAEANVPRFY